MRMYIPNDWTKDEINPTMIATATETPPIVSTLAFAKECDEDSRD